MLANINELVNPLISSLPNSLTSGFKYCSYIGGRAIKYLYYLPIQMQENQHVAIGVCLISNVLVFKLAHCFANFLSNGVDQWIKEPTQSKLSAKKLTVEVLFVGAMTYFNSHLAQATQCAFKDQRLNGVILAACTISAIIARSFFNAKETIDKKDIIKVLNPIEEDVFDVSEDSETISQVKDLTSQADLENNKTLQKVIEGLLEKIGILQNALDNSQKNYDAYSVSLKEETLLKEALKSAQAKLENVEKLAIAEKLAYEEMIGALKTGNKLAEEQSYISEKEATILLETKNQLLTAQEQIKKLQLLAEKLKLKLKKSQNTIAKLKTYKSHFPMELKENLISILDKLKALKEETSKIDEIKDFFGSSFPTIQEKIEATLEHTISANTLTLNAQNTWTKCEEGITTLQKIINISFERDMLNQQNIQNSIKLIQDIPSIIEQTISPFIQIKTKENQSEENAFSASFLLMLKAIEKKMESLIQEVAASKNTSMQTQAQFDKNDETFKSILQYLNNQEIIEANKLNGLQQIPEIIAAKFKEILQGQSSAIQTKIESTIERAIETNPIIPKLESFLVEYKDSLCNLMQASNSSTFEINRQNMLDIKNILKLIEEIKIIIDNVSQPLNVDKISEKESKENEMITSFAWELKSILPMLQNLQNLFKQDQVDAIKAREQMQKNLKPQLKYRKRLIQKEIRKCGKRNFSQLLSSPSSNGKYPMTPLSQKRPIKIPKIKFNDALFPLKDEPIHPPTEKVDALDELTVALERLTINRETSDLLCDRLNHSVISELNTTFHDQEREKILPFGPNLATLSPATNQNGTGFILENGMTSHDQDITEKPNSFLVPSAVLLSPIAANPNDTGFILDSSIAFHDQDIPEKPNSLLVSSTRISSPDSLKDDRVIDPVPNIFQETKPKKRQKKKEVAAPAFFSPRKLRSGKQLNMKC